MSKRPKSSPNVLKYPKTSERPYPWMTNQKGWPYIALQGTTKEPLPQVKLGKALNLRVFGMCF